MKIILRIQTKNEIFGCNEFPIIFLSYHYMVHWLIQPNNHKLIDRIVYINEYYPMN